MATFSAVASFFALEQVDTIVAGLPCQSSIAAGKQIAADARNLSPGTIWLSAQYAWRRQNRHLQLRYELR